MEELIRMVRRLGEDGVTILTRYAQNLINLGYAERPELSKSTQAYMGGEMVLYYDAYGVVAYLLGVTRRQARDSMTLRAIELGLISEDTPRPNMKHLAGSSECPCSPCDRCYTREEEQALAQPKEDRAHMAVLELETLPNGSARIQVNGHIDCPCWATGAFKRVEGCKDHPWEL